MSRLKEKIRLFTMSDNKWHMIKVKFADTFSQLIYKKSFGEFGSNCRISRPLYISGKKHIFLRGGGKYYA